MSSSPSSPIERKAADARLALRAWIVAAAPSLTDATLTDTTPLFADHHLSSLHLPELILTLERLRGRRIDLATLKASHLRDVESLCARFLTDDAPEPKGQL
jgi:hypothetical protein